MTGEDESRALSLVEEALDLPSAERETFVRAHDCSTTVRARALQLLSQGRYWLATGGGPRLARRAPPPDRIGAYRITGLIGEGGMGAVYRGERMTGDFEHQVAIKVVRPGALSDTLAERFLSERQTLARLQHPNIAQLLDGGATDSGDPYIVMELVDGEPLGRWLDQPRSLGERIQLVLNICAAVSFAHQNLIIHRDITPSNVLVTRDGVPKLIDFGIARPPTADDDASRGSRSLASLSLTPGYAAPERSRDGAATTLGDIYSLGKLCARTFEGVDDRDLAAIIRRATALDPQDRYPSADALAEDVCSWRDTRPVSARRGGAAYVARRFARRNKVAVGGAAVALILLLLAFGGALWALQRTAVAKRAEATRFEQVRSLAHYLLFDLNDRLARVPGNTGARAEMADEAQRYLALLVRAADSDRPDLKLEAAQGLVRLARIQGSPHEPNLGEISQAERNLNAAKALVAALDHRTPAVAATEAMARAVHAQILLNDEMRQTDATAEIKEARSLINGLPAGDPDRADAGRIVRQAEIDLADIGADPAKLGQLANALEADIATWPATLRKGRLAETDRTQAIYLRAQSRSEQGAPDRGLPLFLEAERRLDALNATQPADPATLLLETLVLKDAYAAASRVGGEEEANGQRLAFKGDELTTRLIALDDRDQGVRKRAGSFKEAIAQNLRDHDRFAEAIALQQQVVALRTANISPDRNARRVTDLAFSQMILGIIARDAGRRDLACASWAASEKSVSELDKRHQLAGFMGGFLPGLRDKRALCQKNASLTALMKPLR